MRKLATSTAFLLLLVSVGMGVDAEQDLRRGYYQQPALHDDTIVFVAEGDLWKVAVTGGPAVRLTTHAATESQPVISPDGTTVAFVGSYEGPDALYTMPLSGGRPQRWTWHGSSLHTVGWSPNGRLLYATEHFSTLPDMQLAELDLTTGEHIRLPLAQADDGCYDSDGTTLFFTRYQFQSSRTKRYTGGTAQRLWRFSVGGPEAEPLTADYPGTSRDPMWWQGRLYFVCDRDGTMNLWSMLPDGSDLQQHTRHVGWDLLGPSLSRGRVVYQLGADLRLLDLASGADSVVEIDLVSDLDQTREHWVSKPTEYLSAVHLSPDGDRVVLTARGQVFVVPVGQGRLVPAACTDGVRHRDAGFMPDGKQLLTLSDESGEVELWTVPANGVGDRVQLSGDAEVLRLQALPSPDGRWIAHHDKNNRLWLLETASGQSTRIDHNEWGAFSDLAWSPDSRWLAYVKEGANTYRRIHLYRVPARTQASDRVPDGQRAVATSGRFDSWSPVFSRDGKWLCFLSDRHFDSVVKSPWGTLQPEPFFDKRTRIYLLALTEGQRSPFAPADELHPEKETDEEEDDELAGEKEETEVSVEIALDGLAERLFPVPVPPANMEALWAGDGLLLWVELESGGGKRCLRAITLDNTDPKPQTLVGDVRDYVPSLNAEKLLIRVKDDLHVVDVASEEIKLDDKSKVDLSSWALSVVPQEEWRQMLVEAWRLERDYFYDTGMHGVDWQGVLDRYLPLVERVRCREELADLTAQMVSELAAVHTFVGGGDKREGKDRISAGSLGAVLVPDRQAGGARVEHIYRSDPDDPEQRSPLAAPEVAVGEGDLVTHIDGTPVTRSDSWAALLRNKVDRQVLLRVKPAAGGEPRDVIVTPISEDEEADLRYHEWEYTRRLRVEEQGDGQIGYVHLRAMGARNIAEWARHFYPVFHRQGLIIDVRHNQGGSIESWIIEKLLRKVWAAWSERVSQPIASNMQYAFRGHLVVLCDAWTASDGETFLEAIRRLELGTIIGTRTWGGGIWLTASNALVDGGIATAAEFGMFGPEGRWIIEMDGVTPDITVDNLPHATFNGQDAQLDAAIELLKAKIAEEPISPLQAPPAKDLSLKSFPTK